jgi:large-conductance mechanosensitive channel
MKQNCTKLFYLLIILFLQIGVQAQTKFIATITPSIAGKDDFITLKLTVVNGEKVQQITPPDLNNFEVVSGPNQEQSMNNVNGIVTQSISLSYILKAKKLGAFTIGSGIALINGKSYKSNTVGIEVNNKKSNNSPQLNSNAPFTGIDFFEEPTPQKQFTDYVLRNGESVADKINKNMQLKLQTDKNSCYVGEPILATYKLYTRLRSESNITKNPSFNGFSVVDMLQQIDQSDSKYEKLDGREYNVYTIRKAQLYPLQAGSIELEMATLDNKVNFVKYENGGNGNIITENVSLSSKPIFVNVKPLPEKDKPVSFNGAVGNFDMEVSVEKNNFSTDENGVLRILIAGKGNMQLLTQPDIKWPNGFEAFETKITDNTNNSTLPISGNKIFEIPFAVSSEGSFLMPNITFSYFDPLTSVYKICSSKNIAINVLKGDGKNISKIKNSQSKKEENINSIVSLRAVLISLIILSLLAVVVFLYSKNLKKKTKKVTQQNIGEQEKKDSQKILVENISSTNRNYLEKTELCLYKNDCNDFYSVLNEELKFFLANKFALTRETLNTKTLSLAMDNAGLNYGINIETEKLIGDIEWQLYTPFERNEKLNDFYARSQTLIQTIIMHK